MKKLLNILVLVLVAASLSACAFTSSNCRTLTNIREGNGSLVYGYLDLGKAGRKVNWINLYQAKPESDKPYWYACYDRQKNKSMFWWTNVPNGSYRLYKFKSGNTIFSFPQFGPGHKLRLKKPGIYYIGSYKVINTKKKSVILPQLGGTFEVEMLKKPGAKDLLLKLQPMGAGTKWEKPIAKKLKRLK